MCIFSVFSLFFIVAIGAFYHTQIAAADTAAAVQAQKAALQAQLDELTAEIAADQAQLDAKHGESASLQRDISILNGKINQAQLQIKASNIQLAQLADDINVKVKTIETLSDRIDKNKESLADLLRKSDQVESQSLMETMLSNDNLAESVADLDAYDVLKGSLHDLYLQIADEVGQNEQQKTELQQKSDQAADAKAALEAQQRAVEANKKDKNDLLTVTKSEEKNYAAALADRQKKAAAIRAALFTLAGGSAAIPFGDAYAFAQDAQKSTSVDPAFLLAILTQESNLGANVGKCYLTDPNTGAGVNISSGKVWPNVMKASRDVPPFLAITKNLGMDPLQTVVSCPIAGAGGYGGAMGPAQFIASTWQLFASRIQSALGHFGNPWAPQDAFLASAMYLSDLGATGSSYSSELRAACKYYGTGGSTCTYGRQVMAKAASIQEDMINPLQNL